MRYIGAMTAWNNASRSRGGKPVSEEVPDATETGHKMRSQESHPAPESWMGGWVFG